MTLSESSLTLTQATPSLPYPLIDGELWTSRQRQASSLHEISYRACFKPQLPRFFIERYTQPGDIVYDPFMGRGTTIIEAARLGRRVVGNDVNPLSRILTRPRLEIPDLSLIKKRISQLQALPLQDLDPIYPMFFHRQTERELNTLRRYLSDREQSGEEDEIDRWLRMVATNRLTGHSKGFFSVYTLPPNQAATPEQQMKINQKLKQQPEYRDVLELIWKKSKSLLRNVTEEERSCLRKASLEAILLEEDARLTKQIPAESIRLTITSPPFLNVVNYVQDNWLRCWFNEIDASAIARRISVVASLSDWSYIMKAVFHELYRITRPKGWVAFEVGEIRNGSINLEEIVIPLGEEAGFKCTCLFINRQRFTKTSNIWGISNNKRGTNTNRIVLFQKP